MCCVTVTCKAAVLLLSHIKNLFSQFHVEATCSLFEHSKHLGKIGKDSSQLLSESIDVQIAELYRWRVTATSSGRLQWRLAAVILARWQTISWRLQVPPPTPDTKETPSSSPSHLHCHHVFLPPWSGHLRSGLGSGHKSASWSSSRPLNRVSVGSCQR